MVELTKNYNPIVIPRFKQTACFKEVIQTIQTENSDEQDADWTSELAIDFQTHEKMSELKERSVCQQCLKNRLYYCYDCCLPVGDIAVPKVDLPVRCDVIKHWLERSGKSTAVHAKILSPESVDLLDFDLHHNIHLQCTSRSEKGVATTAIRTYSDEEKATSLLLYPADASAVCLDELEDDVLSKVNRVIFLDGTWSQVHCMNLHPSLQGIRKVKLSTYATHYWRSNGKKENPTWLATIEAIYYFYLEYHKRISKGEAYKGQYDNLLFYYTFFHRLVKHHMRAKIRPGDF